MEHRELRVLGDWLRDSALLGNQLANTWWRPTPRAGGGELERNEVAEVVWAEIVSPVTALGADEVLARVSIILDDQSHVEYVCLSGIRQTCMAPPRQNIWGAKLYSFGTPGSNNPLLNTTLKYTTRVSVECLAGGAPITQNYRVRLWGYVYKHNELADVFGTMQFPTQIIDRARDRVLTLSKSPIIVTPGTWKSLPGGRNQGPPKINPLARYAYNAAATNGARGEFQFRFETGNVITPEEEMYFDFDEKDALLLQSLGVFAPANLDYTYLRISGDVHPKGGLTNTPGWPTRQFNNPLRYGWASPFFPANIPLFYTVPLLEKPLLIWNEIGFPAVIDAGAVCAANSIIMALTGIRIEMSA